MARKSDEDRNNLLADVAEMYFLEGKTQAEISKRVGVTRSMVSRMLTEARQKNIVKIKIERRFEYNLSLQEQLSTRFDLKKVIVFVGFVDDYSRYLSRLGDVAAEAIKEYLKPGIILGTAWGTALDATINALEIDPLPDIKIVQLTGALGGRNLEIDGHGVVQKLVNKLGGESYYLNVPYIVDKPETIESLMQVQGVKDTMNLMNKCDVGLFGIGSTELDFATFYSAGYLISEEIKGLAGVGAVGNVGGLFFNQDGQPTAREFQSRSFTISRRDLQQIPIRIGIAGGSGKIRAILGALRGNYINVLVTDELTAKEVLALESKKS
jgi:DNA-binding transcriptional regulator LsrR (DeoR family)